MAWHLAAGEAAHAKKRCIEREAMFLGICHLGTWLRTQTPEGIRLPTGGTGLEALHAEAKAVEDLLWALGLSPTRLCHAVRTAVGRDAYRYPTKTIIHRSQACKTAFRRAEALAAAARAGEVHCLHLLAALLEHPGVVLTRVVADCGVLVNTLHARVVATPWMREAQPAHAKHTAQGVSHLIYVGVDASR
jgi:hypothetical protein